MQIVIDIPDYDYKQIKEYYEKNDTVEAIYSYIYHGTPLPKHHGRMGDLDALETEMVNGINAGNYEEGYENFAHINNMDDCVECVKYAETIIEADKESEKHTCSECIIKDTDACARGNAEADEVACEDFVGGESDAK